MLLQFYCAAPNVKNVSCMVYKYGQYTQFRGFNDYYYFHLLSAVLPDFINLLGLLFVVN